MVVKKKESKLQKPITIDEIFSHGARIFKGDYISFVSWLNAPNSLINSKSPLMLLGDTVLREKVLGLLALYAMTLQDPEVFAKEAMDQLGWSLPESVKETDPEDPGPVPPAIA